MVRRLLFAALGLAFVSPSAAQVSLPSRGMAVQSRVANNAGLAALSYSVASVYREGFAAAGDGGAANYTLVSTACSAPDGGSQISLTGGGCAILDPSTSLSAPIFGAKCDGSTDDTAAEQAMLNVGAAAAIEVNVAPAGKTCMHRGLIYQSGNRIRVDGVLMLMKGANALGFSTTGNVQNVMFGGLGTIDCNGSNQTSQNPLACIGNVGTLTNFYARDLTIKNAKNWNLNLTGGTITPKAGSKHVFLFNLTLIGGENSNEFAVGCDDCHADHLTITGLPSDFGFAFYGNVTNSSITNSKIDDTAGAVTVLSDGVCGTAPNSGPSSDILIEDNQLTNAYGPGVLVWNSCSGGTQSPHKNISVVHNSGYGNNRGFGPNAGGEQFRTASNVLSEGNIWHNDANNASSTLPVAGVFVDNTVDHFKSIGDTVYDEGNGTGIGFVIAPGATYVSIKDPLIYDDQAMPTMAFSFNGRCSSTCQVTGAIINGMTQPPFATFSYDPAAIVRGNTGAPSLFQTYTPTLSCLTGTLASATASGRYSIIEKVLVLSITVNITTNGTCGTAINVSLPPGATVPPSGFGHVTGRENVKSAKLVQGFVPAGSSVMQLVSYDNTYPAVDGASIALSGSFEVQ